MPSRRRTTQSAFLNRIASYFARGLLVFVPAVSTIYCVYLVLISMDKLIPIDVPGAGILTTALFIVLIGFITTRVTGQAIIASFERGIAHLPVVSLLYGSIKDLLNAFVGEKKSFDRPAMVAIDGERLVKIFGFVTCDRFDDARLAGYVAVYLPQAYNFAGNVLVVPRDRVEYVDAEPAQFMAFIVSGGISAMGASQTMMDESALKTLVTSSARPPFPSRPGIKR